MSSESLLAVPSTESPDHRSDQRADLTWVYWGKIDGGRAAKVGHSRQARSKRESQHAKQHFGIAIEYDEVCRIRGKVADEKAIKRYFAPFLIPGETEVFEPVPEIIDYIRWLRDLWFVSIKETSEADYEAMPVVASTEWLPNETRRKPHPVRSRSECLPGLVFDEWDMGHREITGDDFYTNKVVIQAAMAVMGRIDLDPASHPIANKVVQAERFFTIADNGLTRTWGGKVWLNPPFSAWREWVPKILSERNRVEEMCVLSAMRTVTAQYFAPLLDGCNAMCILHGRIKFWGGVAGDSPDDGHAVFYFGTERERFREAFSDIGTVFYSSGDTRS